MGYIAYQTLCDVENYKVGAMNVYLYLTAILGVVALAMLADLYFRRPRQEEKIEAKWSDIWAERLKNGK